LGIEVKFVDINMEGMYVREAKPRILVSACRPLPRRNFTCGHELGHHVFGHGTSLDHLIEGKEKPSNNSPEEFLADKFSSFLLLPAIGVRKAFSLRGWSPSSATPSQIFTVACNFGVGYTTLVYHLLYSFKSIDYARSKTLLRSSPQTIREEILGYACANPLVVVDENWLAKTVDIEVGTKVLLPKGVFPSNDMLVSVDSNAGLFIAARPGISRISSNENSWGAFVRIMPSRFHGRSKYRHLEIYEDS
jgi:Zn-dependent peptidase ImmA (M78 family)